MNASKSALRASAAACLAATLSLTTSGFGFTITKLLDYNTSRPASTGPAGTFSTIGQPTMSNGKYGFLGLYPSSKRGFYTNVLGALEVVADSSTPIPSNTGNFTNFGGTLRNGNVLISERQTFGAAGFFLRMGNGTLTRMVDRSTPVPGGTGTFNTINGSSLDTTGAFAFNATDAASKEGIYLYSNGSLITVADTNTSMPGFNAKFFNFIGSSPSMDGGKVLVRGQGTDGSIFRNGLYLWDNGTLTFVVDSATAIPGGNGAVFSGGLNEYQLRGSTVVFSGGVLNGSVSIYQWANGTITRLVGPGDQMPEGSGPFVSVGQPAYQNGVLVFRGNDQNTSSGIYQKVGTKIDKLVKEGDLVSGRPITFTSYTSAAFDGTQLGFALFTGPDFRADVDGDYVIDGVGTPSAARDWEYYE
jgi:hypothetical protein